MKKHKSVVAILLAVMMIFTMMPMMAFAAEATGWGDEFATVTDKDNETYKTVRTFGSDGLITATATDEKTVVVVGESGAVAPSDKDSEGPAKRYFYKMDGSALVFDGNANNILDGSTWTQTAFAQLKSKVGVKVVAPSYVKDYNAQKPATAVIAPANFVGWKAEVKTSEYDDTKTTEDQKITVSIEFTPATEITGKAGAPEKYGVVADATITVKGVPTSPEKAQFYFDSVGGAAVGGKETTKGVYDGAAHTVVCDEVPGYTVSYEVYNPTTGKWDAVSAVSITDVQEKDIQARATFKKDNSSVPRTFNVNLKPGFGATIGFDLAKSENDDDCTYVVPGTEYDAASYLAFEAYQESTKGVVDAKDKAAIRAINAATKKAVAANEAQLKEYFNDFYEIKAETKKNSPYKATLKIVDKELTSDQLKDLSKKYKALFANIGEPVFEEDEDYGILLGYDNATVLFNNGDYDYEVEFTKAPAGAKVYKGKKGKLAKNKSFTVKAVANDGATVYYKLVNANSKITINKKTGKITVKKGLKKGTYTFKVKAYVPGVHSEISRIRGYEEFQTVKVKIKK